MLAFGFFRVAHPYLSSLRPFLRLFSNRRHTAPVVFLIRQTNGRMKTRFTETFAVKSSSAPSSFGASSPVQCPFRLSFSKSNSHRLQGSSAVIVKTVLYPFLVNSANCFSLKISILLISLRRNNFQEKLRYPTAFGHRMQIPLLSLKPPYKAPFISDRPRFGLNFIIARSDASHHRSSKRHLSNQKAHKKRTATLYALFNRLTQNLFTQGRLARAGDLLWRRVHKRVACATVYDDWRAGHQLAKPG